MPPTDFAFIKFEMLNYSLLSTIVKVDIIQKLCEINQPSSLKSIPRVPLSLEGKTESVSIINILDTTDFL